MTIFASHDELINALSVNARGQKLIFTKLAPSTSVNYVPHTMWLASGNPPAGTTPTNGAGGAVVLTKDSTGAIQFANASGGRTMHLVTQSVAGAVAGSGGTYILVDRIAHANVNNNASVTFSPIIDATSRLATGEGAVMWGEVTGALSGASNAKTITYVNQAGDPGRVTQQWSTVSSAVVGRVPYTNFLWIPLQAGDIGVRSVSVITNVSGTATGTFNLVLGKPIGPVIPITGANYIAARDYVVDVPPFPQIRDNACLSILYIPGSAAVHALQGEIRIVEN